MNQTPGRRGHSSCKASQEIVHASHRARPEGPQGDRSNDYILMAPGG